jgi:hypothetical protein
MPHWSKHDAKIRLQGHSSTFPVTFLRDLVRNECRPMQSDSSALLRRDFRAFRVTLDRNFV